MLKRRIGERNRPQKTLSLCLFSGYLYDDLCVLLFRLMLLLMLLILWSSVQWNPWLIKHGWQCHSLEELYLQKSWFQALPALHGIYGLTFSPSVLMDLTLSIQLTGSATWLTSQLWLWGLILYFRLIHSALFIPCCPLCTDCVQELSAAFKVSLPSYLPSVSIVFHLWSIKFWEDKDFTWKE